MRVKPNRLLLTDAETGQRGFLYTGDPKYLAPYDLGLGQIEPHLQKLADLTADNPQSKRASRYCGAWRRKN